MAVALVRQAGEPDTSVQAGTVLAVAPAIRPAPFPAYVPAVGDVPPEPTEALPPDGQIRGDGGTPFLLSSGADKISAYELVPVPPTRAPIVIYPHELPVAIFLPRDRIVLDPGERLPDVIEYSPNTTAPNPPAAPAPKTGTQVPLPGAAPLTKGGVGASREPADVPTFGLNGKDFAGVPWWGWVLGLGVFVVYMRTRGTGYAVVGS